MWKKVMLVITAGMWILALGQLFFVDKIGSMQARQEVFHTIEEEQGSYEIQMMGKYENEFLTREEETEFLAHWGEVFSLSLEEISFEDTENGHVTYSNIWGEGLTGYCKIITKEEPISKQAFHCTQYMSYYLKSEEGLTKMLQLRNQLQEFAEGVRLDCVPVLVAEYESRDRMTQDEQTSLAHSLAESLDGIIVNSTWEQSNYYSYGYSRDLPYCQCIDGTDMNVLVYMKPSDNGKTRIHLQLPTVSLM